jgi:cytochrome c peroxidase
MTARSPLTQWAPRRWTRIVILVALVSAAGSIAISRRSSAAEPGGHERRFSNSTGVSRTVSTAGAIDRSNPFFEELGSNGRTCFTCHRPAQGWTITPPELQDRFDATNGLDPVFRANDGSNCEAADLSTVENRRQAFALLLARGVIRISMDVPTNAEFEVVDVDDPYDCQAPLASVSVYRRPLPTTNLAFLSAVMWDGRETVPGQAMRDDLITQTRNAVTTHAQGVAPPLPTLRAIVDFELGLFTAQEMDHVGGLLSIAGARGGAETLPKQPFCIGINDPLNMLPSVAGACLKSSGGLDPKAFTLFGAWTNAPSPERQAIARGEAIFNTRQFTITSVPGLNGGPEDPVAGPLSTGTCTLCHDTPNAGNHSVAMALNIGVADASRRAPEMPLYTVRNKATGELLLTTDPGRALVTGMWRDIGKFKGPVLRALASRAPYFHDGSAATLAAVIEFYDTRFGIKFTEQEKADLLAFLRAL